MANRGTPRAQRRENSMAPHTARQIAEVPNASATSTDTNTAGQHVVYSISLADGATATTSYVIEHKFEIVDVRIQKRAGAGGASDTIQITDSADAAISDAIDINDADKVISRASTIDDAKSTIAAGGSFKVVKTKASAANVACLVEVIGFRRA